MPYLGCAKDPQIEDQREASVTCVDAPLAPPAQVVYAGEDVEYNGEDVVWSGAYGVTVDLNALDRDFVMKGDGTPRKMTIGQAGDEEELIGDYKYFGTKGAAGSFRMGIDSVSGALSVWVHVGGTYQLRWKIDNA